MEENCYVLEIKTAPVFVLVRSHQLFFHNVEVDQVEFLCLEKVKRSLNIHKSHLEGAETVSKLEVEVRKLFEVWTLGKVVIVILW